MIDNLRRTASPVSLVAALIVGLALMPSWGGTGVVGGTGRHLLRAPAPSCLQPAPSLAVRDHAPARSMASSTTSPRGSARIPQLRVPGAPRVVDGRRHAAHLVPHGLVPPSPPRVDDRSTGLGWHERHDEPLHPPDVGWLRPGRARRGRGDRRWTLEPRRRSARGRDLACGTPCGAWVCTPYNSAELTASRDDVAALRLVARRTWRYFEEHVTSADHDLPPDNFQEDPAPVVAHRTSPTNIGLYLLSVVAARDFGWIGSSEALERMERTMDSVDTLDHLNGHLFNWYNTRRWNR